MQRLREAMVWAHAANCPCDCLLHRRATHHLLVTARSEHAADKRVLRLFRLSFCVQCYELAKLAVMYSVLITTVLKLLASAFCPSLEMDVGSRSAGIVLFTQLEWCQYYLMNL
jgi:hypothetical protein